MASRRIAAGLEGAAALLRAGLGLIFEAPIGDRVGPAGVDAAALVGLDVHAPGLAGMELGGSDLAGGWDAGGGLDGFGAW